jgi:hypothetical protein
MTNDSLLSDLVDLNEALQNDRAIDLHERKQRDRSIGLQLQDMRNKPDAQARAWLHKVFPRLANTRGQQGERLYHVLCLSLLVIGFFSGWGLASIVLFYDGSQPINIVNALVVLVLPQIFLLLVWILTVLPSHLHLFNKIGAMLGFLNPGRLAGHVADFFNARGKHGLDIFWNPDNTAVLSPASRWLFSFWSQLFAFSFNIGILVKAFFLVSFSDLAFAWSTTLDISNAGFHQFLQILSAPWNAIIPDAVPTAELVSSSRYYRLEVGALSSEASTPQLAIALGQWWPFLIAAVSCYGLLPRMVTLLVSWYRFRHHLRKALTNLVGAPELLARMNSPLVTTMATEPERALKVTAEANAGKTATNHYALLCSVIDWSGACPDKELMNEWLKNLGIEALEHFHAGGRQSTEQDQKLLVSLCSKRDSQGVAILVKAWEPPMLEFVDFVRGVRQHCGQQKPVIILLSAGQDKVSSADSETWQLTLSQLHDPNLHIESIGQEK